MQNGFIADKSLGYAQIAAGGIDVAIGVISAAVLARGPALIRIIPEAQAVRWRDDGIAPTATVGHPLAVGQELIYTGNRASSLQFISQVAGAILNVNCFG